ncbi:MAG: hypothetical protein RL148_1266 [Planctomycetota bacterium]
MLRPLAALVPLALCAACASDELVVTDTDFTGTRVEVRCLGNGFVTYDGQRMSLERCVLLLRQRMRTDPPPHLWVHLRLPDEEVDLGVQVDRLQQEFTLMGVRQVRFP